MHTDLSSNCKTEPPDEKMKPELHILTYFPGGSCRANTMTYVLMSPEPVSINSCCLVEQEAWFAHHPAQEGLQ